MYIFLNNYSSLTDYTFISRYTRQYNVIIIWFLLSGKLIVPNEYNNSFAWLMCRDQDGNIGHPQLPLTRTTNSWTRHHCENPRIQGWGWNTPHLHITETQRACLIKVREAATLKPHRPPPSQGSTTWRGLCGSHLSGGSIQSLLTGIARESAGLGH